MSPEPAAGERLRWRCPCGFETDFMAVWVLHGFQCKECKP